MTTRDNHYADLSNELNSPQMKQLIQDLETAYTFTSSPPLLPDSIVQVARTKTILASPVQRKNQRFKYARTRIVSLVAALTLATGSILGYQHFQTPETVSAQAILARAAAVLSTPNQIRHKIERTEIQLGQANKSDFQLGEIPTESKHISILTDLWLRSDTTGNVVQQAAINSYKDNSGKYSLLDHSVQYGQSLFTYNALSHKVTAGPANTDLDMFGYLGGPNDMKKIVLDAGRNSSLHMLVKENKLDGHNVYVISLEGGSTLYIEKQSFEVYRSDTTLTQDGHLYATVSTALVKNQLVAPTEIPANAFTFHPSVAAKYEPSAYSCFGLGSTKVAEQQSIANFPLPLLANNSKGMHLHYFYSSAAGSVFLMNALYETSASGKQYTSNKSTVFVDIIPTFGEDSQMVTTNSPLQSIGVSLAGQRVQGSYTKDATYKGQKAQAFIYHQGQSTIEIMGLGLTQQEFFETLTHFVDGHTDAHVVQKLQKELNLYAKKSAPLVACVY